MSYPVRVYGPVLNQSLSQYWSVLQMCVTFCKHQITKACGAAWKCLHGWIFSPPVRT